MSLLDEMAVHFRIAPADLLRIIDTAPARYKEYTIPKRTGGVRRELSPCRTKSIGGRHDAHCERDNGTARQDRDHS